MNAGAREFGEMSARRLTSGANPNGQPRCIVIVGNEMEPDPLGSLQALAIRELATP